MLRIRNAFSSLNRRTQTSALENEPELLLTSRLPRQQTTVITESYLPIHSHHKQSHHQMDDNSEDEFWHNPLIVFNAHPISLEQNNSWAKNWQEFDFGQDINLELTDFILQDKQKSFNESIKRNNLSKIQANLYDTIINTNRFLKSDMSQGLAISDRHAFLTYAAAWQTIYIELNPAENFNQQPHARNTLERLSKNKKGADNSRQDDDISIAMSTLKRNHANHLHEFQNNIDNFNSLVQHLSTDSPVQAGQMKEHFALHVAKIDEYRNIQLAQRTPV